MTSRKRTAESGIEYFFNTAITPLENLFNYFGRIMDDGWRTVTGLARLKVENDRLRAEIKELKASQLGLNALKGENRRLRESLNFQNGQSNRMVAAEIIAVNPSNWRKTYLIDKGSDFGIRKNMAVISPRGVVGRIGEVRDNSAEVILLTDPREGNFIGGIVARNQNMVIMTGGGNSLGQCTVKPAVDNYFLDLKKNDLVVTAEISDRFPSGIPIGRIVSVKSGANNLVYKAFLKPMVNLGKIQIVYVITRKIETSGVKRSLPQSQAVPALKPAKPATATTPKTFTAPPTTAVPATPAPVSGGM